MSNEGIVLVQFEICPGLNSSTKFTKTAKIRNYRIFVKFAVLVEPLSSQATR